MKRGLCLVILIAGWFEPAWSQNNPDGNWVGRIMCDALPDAPNRLNQPLTIRIAGGRASYERVINLATGEATGNFELGDGPVTADGQVTLTGRGTIGANSYRANYAGRITGQTLQLSGAQIWTYGRRGVAVNRNCTITATRGR